MFCVQKGKFRVKPFSKGLREFESRALKGFYSFYVWKGVFERGFECPTDVSLLCVGVEWLLWLNDNRPPEVKI